MIEELPDRWLVRPRHVRVESATLLASDWLEIKLATDLHLEVIGQWVLARSVARIAPPELQAEPAEMVGSQQASLVLFDSGSAHLVLLNGLMLRASVSTAHEIRCYRPGDFRWVSRAGVVTRERSATSEMG